MAWHRMILCWRPGTIAVVSSVRCLLPPATRVRSRWHCVAERGGVCSSNWRCCCSAPMGSGRALSAILAAVMSTLSCQLLACSSRRDHRTWRRRSCVRRGQREAGVGWPRDGAGGGVDRHRAGGQPGERVLGTVSYAGPVSAPPSVGGADFGDGRAHSRNGALAGMLVGAVTVIVWKQYEWLGL